jgi:methylmalonyl-CoA mutase N-terminal domain/subunit
MADPAYKPKVRDLAAAIYANLVDRSVSVTASGVKMEASAQHLAELSFRLADAFQAVEDGLNAENMPKNPTFKLGVEDIAEWSKSA